MPSVLNVGGGSKAVAIPAHYEGWEHLLLDIDPKRGVDVVCDARLLGEKFSAGSYDAIYCSHNLEHYYLHDVKKVLGGFLHVLKEEGFAEIRVPDIGELIRLLASAQLDLDQEIYKSSVGGISAHDMIYGYGPEIEESGQDFYAHKAGFTRRTLANALFENGFAEVYFAPPMALLELHVFAFKRAATERVRTSLVLGERYLPDTGPARTARPSIAAADRAIQNREADPVDALYAQAVAAWNDEHWAEAIRLADAALKLDGSLPALHYLAGCCRMEAGDITAAVKDFDACLGLAPGYPLSGQALARRALGLARSGLAQGTKATELTLAPDDVRSVSVIMCSANPARFAEAKARYERLLQGLPHEIVGISDARSLAEGYNRGLAKARNDIFIRRSPARLRCRTRPPSEG